MAVVDFGYLLDNDSDGKFDTFQNIETGVQTKIELRAGVYLIDINGDHQWDYEFNVTSGTLMGILHQVPVIEKTSFPLLLIAGLIIIVVLLVFLIVYRRRFHKKQ